MKHRRSVTFWRACASGVLALVAASASGAPADERFGAGVTLKEPTPLASVIEQPSSYEGKTVAVEGIVTAVCSEMGCWMALAPSERSDKALLIQVAHDGVVIFPMSAKGKRATAQGTVERNGRHGRAAEKEHAEHRDQAEPEAVGGWQISATGAVLK